MYKKLESVYFKVKTARSATTKSKRQKAGKNCVKLRFVYWISRVETEDIQGVC